MTRIYKRDNLKEFVSLCKDYLDQDTVHTMTGLYNHLGISKKTYSRYKQRGGKWYEVTMYFKTQINNKYHERITERKLLSLEKRLERQKQKMIKQQYQDFNDELNKAL